MLKAKTPIRGEEDIEFDEPSHTYTVRGKKVPISVTALGGRAVPLEHQFNGVEVINRNLTSWRNKASSKYHGLVAGVTDAQARENVLALWDRNRDAGTTMHKLRQRRHQHVRRLQLQRCRLLSHLPLERSRRLGYTYAGGGDRRRAISFQDAGACAQPVRTQQPLCELAVGACTRDHRG